MHFMYLHIPISYFSDKASVTLRNTFYTTLYLHKKFD